MSRGMDAAQMDTDAMWAALDWQVELGADEAILDVPVDRTALDPAPARAAPARAAPAADAPDRRPPPPEVDPVAAAEAAAAAAQDLEGLRAAMAAYPHSDLKKGARSLVFSDGHPSARVMIVGEAPGQDEDRQGRPFVGRAGQLLDLMFGEIGLGRTSERADGGLYLTNVLVWRPPQNRDPEPAEAAMMLPFLRRHVALAKPEVLVAMGNHACQALIGQRGITRLRGRWDEAWGLPVLPMLHPAYLLRNPHMKREAWADLLELQSRLRGNG